MVDNVREIIRYPEGFEHPDQVRDLSDADLKQAAMAALQRNVWSPLAKASLSEVWRRWSAMVTLAEARQAPPYTGPRESAFGMLRGETKP